MSTAKLYKRCIRPGDRYPLRADKELNATIQRLADEGQIEIRDRQQPVRPEDRAGQRYVRLTAGPVEPAPEPEPDPESQGPTRTQMIADLIGRHPLTEAEAEAIRALLPPERG